MLRILFTFTLITSVFLNCSAKKFEETRDGIIIPLNKTLSGGASSMQIKFLADDIVQVLVYPDDDRKEPLSLCVENKEWSPIKFEIAESNNQIIVSSKDLQLEISMPEGRITYLDKWGKVLLQENGRSLQAVALTNDSGVKIRQDLKFQTDEAIYGWGQYEGGIMNWRGHVAELKQENTGTAVPVFVSTRGYGMLWDNYSFTKFVDKQQTFISSELGDALNYYFFYGPTLDEVIASYRQVTGTAPMFPKWAYGYTQSRENYESQEDVLYAARELRRREIPFDVIIKDWNYWEQGQWGQKSMREDLFPDPKSMIDELNNKLNAHTLISIWPNLEKGSPDYNEFIDKEDFYFPMESFDPDENGFIIYNAFNEGARKLYWQQVEKGILAHGFEGLWCDSSEPEPGFLDNDNDKNKTKLSSKFGSGTRYFNAYPLMHAKGIYENWMNSGRSARLVNLTRSGYSGQQKYGTICWSGDISATWNVFKTQIAAGLNFCMTGIPYWGNDIGAFFVKPEINGYLGGGDYEHGPEDDGYKELYVRWIQFGAFCPQMRSHGTDFPREPWRFGDEGTWAYDAIVKMINLRYRLMPYIYSVANKVTTEHYTIMRGMAMDFQDDVMVYDINDQYMFGPAIMVSPVVQEKVNHRNIYLPEGSGWYNFWDGNYLTGGQTIVEQTPIDIIPLYVKSGSIVPLGPDVQYSTEKTDPIEIRIFEGADGEFDIYEDDNETYNYKNGEFSKIKFTWDDSNKILTIHDIEGEYSGMNPEHTFRIVLFKKRSKLHTWTGLGLEAGMELSENPDEVIKYTGDKVEVSLY